LLFACSCSAAVTQTDGEFLKILAEAAKNARKDLTILSITSAAADHPNHIGSPAGYLTAVLARIK
jgi:23S rRNA G2069 N7-methylase RlmK/C1962 C5-methylase RlmI